MNRIYADITNVAVYIDDIIVATNSLEEYHVVLKKVLQRLKGYNVRINFEKSEFYTDDVEILGNRLTQGKVYPKTNDRENILKAPVKRGKIRIQRILCVLNWFRIFIPNLSTRIIEITDKLLLKKEEVVWSKRDDEAVTEIRKFLEEKSFLVLPDYSKRFNLQVDASIRGLGGGLYQDHSVITYLSKRFNSTEINYSIVEKEMYAICYCLDKVNNIVFGNHVNIFTDNRNCLFSSKQETDAEMGVLIERIQL